MNKMVREWLFINYCGQKIGQFKTANLFKALINISVTQVFFPSLVPTYLLLLYIGFRSPVLFMGVVIIQLLVFRYIAKKVFSPFIDVRIFNERFKLLSIKARIMNFIISIIITIMGIAVFAYSFLVLRAFS